MRNQARFSGSSRMVWCERACQCGRNCPSHSVGSWSVTSNRLALCLDPRPVRRRRRQLRIRLCGLVEDHRQPHARLGQAHLDSLCRPRLVGLVGPQSTHPPAPPEPLCVPRGMSTSCQGPLRRSLRTSSGHVEASTRRSCVELPHQRLSLASIGFAPRSFSTNRCASGVRCFSAMSATVWWPLQPHARAQDAAQQQATRAPAHTKNLPLIFLNRISAVNPGGNSERFSRSASARSASTIPCDRRPPAALR